MIPLGLSAADRRTLLTTLFGHHRMRVLVHSLRLDGTYDADLSARLIDGQIDVDGTADVTRTASLTLLDATGSLDFDSDSPVDAALFLDRMLHVEYGVRVDFGHGNGWEWFDVPVFTGPITGMNRDGNTVGLTASGKEVLCMGAVWRPLTLRKNTRKTYAIRTILAERAGETRFEIPQLRARLPQAMTLGRDDVPWNRARRIARSLGNRQLFYDGRGVVRLRRHPHRPVLTFTASTLLSEPQVTYSQDHTVNAVFIRGGVPKGKHVQLTAQVFASRTHPLSPWRLGRNGVPRYLIETVEDSHIRSVVEAVRLGRERLSHGLAQAVSATFDAIPVPMLEPGDLVRALTDQGAVTVRASTFSLPLTAGQPMPVGYHRTVSPRRRHGRGSRLHTRTVVHWVKQPQPHKTQHKATTHHHKAHR